jgi:CRP/FNR family transcriptional regulator, dissimilatory nitrate respiration regulator
LENLFEVLAATNLFNGLGKTELEGLLHLKPWQLKEFERDMPVAHAGDPCHDLLIVVQGSVRGEMTDFSGKKLKIEDIIAPRPLAIAFLFGRENRFPVDILANEPSTVMFIPRDVLIHLLQNSQPVLRNYLNAISSRTQFLSNKIRFLSFKTIREKLANFILTHAELKGNTCRFNQTQAELADFFGVTRPSLARTLAELEAEGIVKSERRQITILDREKLNNLLSH